MPKDDDLILEIQNLRFSINHMSSKLDAVDSLIRGDADPAKGFIVRMDRVERWVRGVTATLVVVVSALVTAFVRWYFGG